MTVPTFLIGLGGIGSRVVDRLYDMVPEHRRPWIAVHAIDTNINDISRLGHIRAEQVTQISDRMTVGEYLDALRRSGEQTTVAQWFPENVPGSIKMTDGAGQTRAVARLAYHATLRRDRGFPKLEKQIDHLFRVEGSERVTSVRVIIVCSIGGGTGAGTFLQTARYVRDLIKEKQGASNILVRGMFMLPSVTRLFNQKVSDGRRMSANGYACLKELNALFMSERDATGRRVRPTIELEYRPGQGLDAEGRINLAIPADPPIYDFCFLQDAHNIDGKTLGSGDYYEAQLVRSLYMQLFSPVAEDNFSQEDNVISTLIGGRQNARFCASGTASAVYPYGALLDYFALRSANQALDDEWLTLDDSYRDALRHFEVGGRLGTPPQRGDIFAATLRHEAEQKRPRPFFKALWQSLHEMDETGQPRDPAGKVGQFLDAVDKRIETVVKGWKSLQEACQRFDVPGELPTLEDDDILRCVVDGETALRLIRFQADASLGQIEQSLLNDILFNALHGDTPVEDCSLARWLVPARDPLHPLATRFFLYRLDEVLERRLTADQTYGQLQGARATSGTDALNEQVTRLRRAVAGYPKVYDDPATEDEVETAEDLFHQASQQNRLARLFSSDMKKFADRYASEANRQFQVLGSLALAAARQQVYERLRQSLATMIRQWEDGFDALKNRLPYLREREALERVAQERLGDQTRIQVLASARCKDALWDGVRSGAQEGDPELTRAIVDGQLRLALEQLRQAQGVERFDAVAVARQMETTVLGFCRAEIDRRGTLKMNLVSALRREAGILGEDPDRHVETVLAGLRPLAAPWIDYTRDASVDEYGLWGFSPVVARDLGETLVQKLAGDKKAIDTGFSEHEVICYRSVYGLPAEHLRKFSAGGGGLAAGEMYREYQAWIKDVDGPGAPRVTPHLDRRWHYSNYMPDLNEAQIVHDAARTQRAFLFGLLYNLLQRVRSEGHLVWQYHLGRYSQLVRDGAHVVAGELHRLYESLSSNPSVVDEILGGLEARMDTDRSRYSRIQDTLTYRAFKRLDAFENRNLLDLVLSLPDAPGASDHLRTSVPDLVDRLLLEIGRFYCGFHLRGTAEGGIERLGMEAANSLRNLVDALFQDSAAWQRLDRGSDVHARLEGIRQDFLARIGTGVVR